jgi:hypothetical protein
LKKESKGNKLHEKNQYHHTWRYTCCWAELLFWQNQQRINLIGSLFLFYIHGCVWSKNKENFFTLPLPGSLNAFKDKRGRRLLGNSTLKKIPSLFQRRVLHCPSASPKASFVPLQDSEVTDFSSKKSEFFKAIKQSYNLRHQRYIRI